MNKQNVITFILFNFRKNGKTEGLKNTDCGRDTLKTMRLTQKEGKIPFPKNGQ